MSSMNRGAEYERLARYYTPTALARVLIDLLPIRRHDVIYEGHAGGGAWVRAVLGKAAAAGWNENPTLMLSDIDPDAQALKIEDRRITHREVRDFLDTRELPYRPNWIVGNPPFTIFVERNGRRTAVSSAEDHVRHALSLADNVAFLLRLNFLGGNERAELWQTHPAKHVYVLSQRPSFTTDGSTDSCEYAMFVWESGWRGQTGLDVISWR